MNLTKSKIIFNLIFILFLITFSNLGFLPFENSIIFVFICLLIFIFSWYRLDLSFSFFVGLTVLENINLAPIELGISIRPYQIFGGIIFLAFLLKLIFVKLKVKLLKFYLVDVCVLIFIFSGFLSTIFSLNKSISLKQSVIITSFGIVYFLFRIFIQNLEDLKRNILFFISSSFGVVIYGIWQNWQFMRGGSHFEIMAGRPNATFTEPDWLGMFLIFLLAALLVLTFKENKLIKNFFKQKINLFYFSFLTLVFVLLILTVARSAWLGAGMVLFSYLLLTLINSSDGWKKVYKKLNWKNFFAQGFIIFSSVIIAIGLVYFFKLTNFELKNRIQSTGSGKQEITISCILNDNFEDNQKLNNFLNLSKEIESVEELEQYDCRHINLEEIESEKLKGNLVTRVYRSDPNVNVRAEVYKKSWREIKNNCFFGIGWGSIGSVLGVDEAGTVLNSSNVFLEIWLGSGILGLFSFVTLLIIIFRKGLILFFDSNLEKKLFGIYLILGIIAILIPNIFNAGIMLGFLWLFFGIANIDDF